MSEHLAHLHEWREAIAESIVRMDSGETDNGIMGQIRAQQHDTLDKTIKELEALRQQASGHTPNETAHQRFTECGGEEVTDPLERLRFYCSLAMAGQDWLDAEPFFDALAVSLGEPVGEVVWVEPSVHERWPQREPYKDVVFSKELMSDAPIGTKLYLSAAAVPDAHELWVAAQLMPGEGIEDGVRRIEALQGRHEPEGAG